MNCYNGRLPVEALAHHSWPPGIARTAPYSVTGALHRLTSLCSATYVRSQRVTARIYPPHAAAAAIDQYLLPVRHTAASLWRLNGTVRRTDGRRTVS